MKRKFDTIKLKIQPAKKHSENSKKHDYVAAIIINGRDLSEIVAEAERARFPDWPEDMTGQYDHLPASVLYRYLTHAKKSKDYAHVLHNNLNNSAIDSVRLKVSTTQKGIVWKKITGVLDEVLDLSFEFEPEAYDKFMKKLATAAKKDTSFRDSIMYAARYDHDPKTIRRLVKEGASLDAYDDGYTALTIACCFNCADVVKALVKLGSDIEFRGKYGRTPFLYACEYNVQYGPEVVDALIELGADIHAVDMYGHTALMNAAAWNVNQIICTNLIKHGLDVNAKNKGGETPLMLAARLAEHPAVIKVLLNRGANIDEKCLDPQHNGSPVILAAKFNKNPEIVQTLIDAGANMRLRDNEGNTAKQYMKRKDGLYPFRYAFYKEKDEPGWISAIMSGDASVAEKRLKKLKKRNGWFDAKIRGGGATHHLQPLFANLNLNAYITHMTSNWRYSIELDRWFLDPEETIPVPNSKCEKTNNLAFEFDFPEEHNDFSDDDQECFPLVFVSLKTRKQSGETLIEWIWSDSDINDLLKNLKRSTWCYTHIVINEIGFVKFLLWSVDDKVRFKMQDYNDDEVYEPVDILIDRQVFIKKLEKLLRDINKQAKKMNATAKKKV